MIMMLIVILGLTGCNNNDLETSQNDNKHSAETSNKQDEVTDNSNEINDSSDLLYKEYQIGANMGDGKVICFKQVIEDNTENHKVTQKTVKFTLGKAITEAKCSDFGEYVTDGGTVTKNSDGTSTLSCTFDKNGSTDTGNNFQIGSLVVTVKKDSADEDCSIGVENGNSTGTKNPETGASLPLTIVAIGLAVGTGVYFGTKKRTKLYKI